VSSDGREEQIRYQGVELSRDGVGEWRKGQRTALVARPIVRGLALREGPLAEYPGASIGLGATLGVLGLLSLWGAIALGEEGVAFWIFAVLFVPVGLLVMRRGLRRGQYLEVVTTVGRQKMAFDGPVEERALAELLERAHRQFDLPPAKRS
jgi:hypothetical protein